jgi:hypothetical protein
MQTVLHTGRIAHTGDETVEDSLIGSVGLISFIGSTGYVC